MCAGRRETPVRAGIRPRRVRRAGRTSRLRRVAAARFLLIRHAESEWNAAGRWQGQADPPLSVRGRAQARGLGRRLRDRPIEVLLSSDLTRALQTARAVGALHGLSPRPDPRLRELDIGRWSGLLRREIEARDPGLLRRFSAGDPDARPPGGETRREIRQRVRAAMAEIGAAHPDRTVGVVTHLGVLRALLPGSEVGNACWLEVGQEDLAAPVREPDALPAEAGPW